MARSSIKGTINHTGPRTNEIDVLVKAAETVYGIQFRTRRRSFNWFRRYFLRS